MNTSVKTLASAALVAALVGGLQSSAKATNFEPLGEGVLPSGKFVQDFKFTLVSGRSGTVALSPRSNLRIVSGTLTEEKGCGLPADIITAGSAFTEAPGVIHRVFNYGTENVVIVFTFIVPPRYAGYTGTIFVNGPRCDD